MDMKVSDDMDIKVSDLKTVFPGHEIGHQASVIQFLHVTCIQNACSQLLMQSCFVAISGFGTHDKKITHM